MIFIENILGVCRDERHKKGKDIPSSNLQIVSKVTLLTNVTILKLLGWSVRIILSLRYLLALGF